MSNYIGGVSPEEFGNAVTTHLPKIGTPTVTDLTKRTNHE